MGDKKYPHAVHRQRVRKAFLQSGTESIPDRGLLEFLLFYAIPRRDTNELASHLLEEFGSLKAVFDASYDELIKFDGIGESAALLLSSLPEISKRYAGEKVSPRAIYEPGEAESFVRALFEKSEKEEFYIICVDAAGRAFACEKLASGDESSVKVDKKAVLRVAFENDADSVIFAHNHPKGETAPSKADTELTRDASRLLAETGIKLADHIIYGSSGCLSLASTAKFSNIFTGE